MKSPCTEHVFSNFCLRQEMGIEPTRHVAKCRENSLPEVIVYPLVNIQKASENGHRNSGFSHEKL